MVQEGKLLAAYIGTGVMLLAIGVLNLASEFSAAFKKSLVLSEPTGPYSGKILFGVLCGAVVWGILYYALKDREKVDSKAGFYFFIAALLLATLFVFTPFIHLFEAD